MHELALGYKMWAGKATDKEQRAIGGGPLCDLTQRLFLGWDPDSLINQNLFTA